MAKIEPDLKKAKAVVYAISNENGADLEKMRKDEGLGKMFVSLSDGSDKAGNLYAGHLEGKTVLKAATFVVGKDRKIVYAYVGENIMVRAAADSVLRAVRDAMR